MTLWASVVDECAPIPFVGSSAAPVGSPTVIDELLENALRMIRLDAYRMATIVMEYASCAEALYMRLLLDTSTERLQERQKDMAQRLRTAGTAIIGIRRQRSAAIGEMCDDDGMSSEDVARVMADSAESMDIRDYIDSVLRSVYRIGEMLQCCP
jgi:hypothetical protein